ncbi:protein PXR1 [Capsella rubella]|uniref:protein PXR1 n=1 Tax=Capsella rubella TaxID=81985 RepID=UPI000CD56D6A|nr:protein PXR1 [Capsella rubella]
METYNESELEGDKDKSEEAGQSNTHEDIGKEDRVFDENVNSTFEDSFRQANTQDGSYAGEDENTEKNDNSDNAEEGTPRKVKVSRKDKKNSQQKARSSKKKVVRERKEKKCKEGDNAEENVSERKEQKKRKTSNNQMLMIQQKLCHEERRIKLILLVK